MTLDHIDYLNIMCWQLNLIELGCGEKVIPEGTQKIEQFDTMEICREKEEKEQSAAQMEVTISEEVAKLKDDLVINLRDQLMTEQALLFDKMKQELTIKMHKELIRMRKNLENKRQEVYSSWTQVEAGDFPLNNNEDAESSLDSANLLAE